MEGHIITPAKGKAGLWVVFWAAVAMAAFAVKRPQMLVLAILALTAGALVRTFNHRGFFRIENGEIHTRYHWFGRLDCKLDEAAFSDAQNMTLNILCQNGRRYDIGFLINAGELCQEIRRQNMGPEQEAPGVLMERMKEAHQKRRRDIHGAIGGCVLMFANIALTVLLTGGRETHEFSGRDWAVFAVMAILEAAVVIGTFAVACRSGRHLLDMNFARYRLRNAVVLNQLLPSNRVKAVYIDADITGRLVICDLPDGRSPYYIIQEFNKDFRLVTVETSRIFENTEMLMEELPPELIEITSWYSGKF